MSPTGWATGTLSPIRGATGTHFWKFPYSPYIFEILIFFKYKNEKGPIVCQGGPAQCCLTGSVCHANTSRIFFLHLPLSEIRTSCIIIGSIYSNYNHHPLSPEPSSRARAAASCGRPAATPRSAAPVLCQHRRRKWVKYWGSTFS